MRTILSSVAVSGLLLLAACDSSPKNSVPLPPTRINSEQEFRLEHKLELAQLTLTLKRGIENGSQSPKALLRAGQACANFDTYYAGVADDNQMAYEANARDPNTQHPYTPFTFTVEGIALCDAVHQIVQDSSS